MEDRHIAAPDQDPARYTFEIDKILKDADFKPGQAEKAGVGFELPAKLKPEVQLLSLGGALRTGPGALR